MILLMFVCAFALSGVAAFYSIAGLMAIFAAAPTSIAIMGSILEMSKLVVASWLYRNWTPIPKLMKGYLTGALAVLMLLTSMGIFGFLSKAHLEQSMPSSDIAAQVSLIDEKIKNEKDNINEARIILSQLDSQVNQALSRTTTDTGVNRSVSIRQQQTKERAALTKQIEAAQAQISKLNQERAPIAAQLRKVEAEVGPIKYIAALIYGDEVTTEQTTLEKAVRWVIILIVAVFDPLAVVMLIAANWSLLHRVEKYEIPDQPISTPVEDMDVDMEVTNSSMEVPVEISTEVLAVPETPPVEPHVNELPTEEHVVYKTDADEFWRAHNISKYRG